MLGFSELDHIPEGLLELPAARLLDVLDGPTLIHLRGRQPRPLFVSVLLHGNEDTGWEAMRALLKKYQGRELPRSLVLFIGNVAAARDRLRHQDGLPDYNRIWKADGRDPEHDMVRRILERLRELEVFASIDIHNNTGFNPHYACVNRLEHSFLHLATLFSRTVVYFIRPDSVQSMAMARLCPAVTVECGKPGVGHGVEHALEFVESVLHLNHFPEHPIAPHDYDLFHTVATVKIPHGVEFGFDGGARDLALPEDLDRLNFRELPAGTTLGWTGADEPPVVARDEVGEAVTARYFDVVDGELRTRLPVMPSMLTLDARVIRQDCLCYLMERLPPLPAETP